LSLKVKTSFTVSRRAAVASKCGRAWHDHARRPPNLDVGEPGLALSESIGESDPNRDQLASIGPSGAAVTTNPSTRTRLNTYTTYSIGCAAAWGAILLVAQRRLDAQNRSTLRLVCGGWWMGWTSATIARIGFPPPKPLTPAAENRLRIVSIVLVGLGFTSTIRFLATGERPTKRAGRRRR
jgi:hypothetical protein